MNYNSSSQALEQIGENENALNVLECFVGSIQTPEEELTTVNDFVVFLYYAKILFINGQTNEVHKVVQAIESTPSVILAALKVFIIISISHEKDKKMVIGIGWSCNDQRVLDLRCYTAA